MQTHNKRNDEKREENGLENVDGAVGKVGSEWFYLISGTGLGWHSHFSTDIFAHGAKETH